jgi:hypothetical protein
MHNQDLTSFDNGTFTIGSILGGSNGWVLYFEHNQAGEDMAGKIRVEDGAVMDYDGVYELPASVVRTLEEQFGLDVEYI